MKKTMFVFVAFATMFLMICCGGGSSSDDKPQQGGECEMQEGKDVFSCAEKDGAFVVLKCAEGKWAEHEKCTAEQACNSETGKCEGGEEPKPNNCGNRMTDEGEVCDGDAKECSAIDPTFTGGYASCKADCTGYDTTACSSNGGGNGGGSTGNCPAIFERYFTNCSSNISDHACLEAALEGETEDDKNLFLDYYRCIILSNCTQTDCAECATEYTACTGQEGGGSSSGTASCGEIRQCLQGVTDQASAQACFNSGTQESQQTYLQLQDCIQQNNCTALNCEQCTTEYNTCANS